ncbi:MAG: L,D-transpeptidase [Paracoccaceae bacterium]
MSILLSPIRRALMLAASLALLAGCVQPTTTATSAPETTNRKVPASVMARYAGSDEGPYHVATVDPNYLDERRYRVTVAYTGPEPAGTIVVDPYARVLYLVTGPQRAWRYGIAVGRAGKGFSGNATIQRKEEWPSWTPTARMVRTEPELYAAYAGGLPGGGANPLGARALYLYRGGRDTYYRIHGTNETYSIGRATSAGCIRLFNQDIIDLFERVPLGAHVKVRTLAESQAQEGVLQEGSDGLLQLVVPPAWARGNG